MAHLDKGNGGAEADAGAAMASTAERIRAEGEQLAATARAKAMEVAEVRKTEAAGFVRDLSSAISRGSEALRERGRAQSADYVNIAADELDRLGTRLDGRDVGELLEEVQRFARRRPGLLFGAALLAGFGMVRLAMSSKARAADEPSESAGGRAPGSEYSEYEER